MDEFDGHKLHNIDGVPTAITGVFGNYAQGFTIKNNSIKVICFIARVNNSFAHGETLRKAVEDASRKALQSKPIEERIQDTVKKYPDPLQPIQNSELFSLHNILTGSCEFGRKQFCDQYGISLDDSMTMKQFITLTINDFGGDNIELLAEAYGITLKNTKK